MSLVIKHDKNGNFLLGLILSFLFTFFCGLGVALGLKLKDIQYQNPEIVPWEWDDWSSWNWKEFLSTVQGSLIGQGLQILIIWLCIG
jgi:hypothetical protein